MFCQYFSGQDLQCGYLPFPSFERILSLDSFAFSMLFLMFTFYLFRSSNDMDGHPWKMGFRFEERDDISQLVLFEMSVS
jgi:hypothetical protein